MAKTELAGQFSQNHCVLACPAHDLGVVIEELRRLDLTFQIMPVPFAFHSRWIESAQAAFSAAANTRFEAPYWPVWSSCLARPIEEANADLSWRIVREPMRVAETFAAIEEIGGARYIDLSPSGSLAAILRQNRREASRSEAITLLSPFGSNLKRLEALLG